MPEISVTQVNNKKWAASVSVLLLVVVKSLVSLIISSFVLLFGLIIEGLQNVPGALIVIQLLASAIAIWFCVRYICSRISTSTVFSAELRTVFRIIILYIGVTFVLNADEITSGFADNNLIPLLGFALQMIFESFFIYYFFQYYGRRSVVQPQ